MGVCVVDTRALRLILTHLLFFVCSLVIHKTHIHTIMFRGQIREFHSTARSLIRLRNKHKRTKPRDSYRLPGDIKLRAPILPTINNLEFKTDHPLWQFFDDKQFVRQRDDLTFSGRSWSVPELRKKSFEDLHQLWYICLRERNRLYREEVLFDKINSPIGSDIGRLSTEIRHSMLAIKQVLTERQSSHDKALIELKEAGEEYLEEFRQSYLQAEVVETDEWYDTLERLQFAIFGIPDIIEADTVVDLTYLKGIKYIGQLKYEKFKDQIEQFQLGELRDIHEIFLVYEESATLEGVTSACEKIEEYRQGEIIVPGSKEIEVIQGYIQDKVQYMSGLTSDVE